MRRNVWSRDEIQNVVANIGGDARTQAAIERAFTPTGDGRRVWSVGEIGGVLHGLADVGGDVETITRFGAMVGLDVGLEGDCR